MTAKNYSLMEVKELERGNGGGLCTALSYSKVRSCGTVKKSEVT